MSTSDQLEALEEAAAALSGLGLDGLADLLTWWSDSMSDDGGSNDDRHYATLNLNIDRPFEMGGVVTWCCVIDRSDCAEETVVPCWDRSAPEGYLGCCCLSDADGASQGKPLPEASQVVHNQFLHSYG